MSDEPLRAIILDNDETTGSYILVYSILIGVTMTNTLTRNDFCLILQRLARWMIIHNVFRPGLRTLLDTISTLRKGNAIDAIIMYTNQTGEMEFLLENKKYNISVPQSIAYMIDFLTDCKPFFDSILMRVEGTKPDPNGWFPKTFSRILNLYPNKPKDIRQIVFVDDLSTPEYIHAYDIPNTHKSLESWYPIRPYYRYLSDHEIRECIRTCFEDIIDLQNHPYFFKDILDYYRAYYHNLPSSSPNAKHFIALSEYLIKRFPIPI